MNTANMSITEIRGYVSQLEKVSEELLEALYADRRKGVREIADKLKARMALQARQESKWAEMTVWETQLRQEGKSVILGMDEAGRGPLAGPVVACAVALPESFFLPGLNDSKQVPPSLREAFYEVIVRDALCVGIGIVDAKEIDRLNILQATFQAMRAAVEDCGMVPDVCLLDAVRVPGLPFEQIPLVGGDGKSVTIAAASIVAKVTRDRIMAEYAKQYPQYGFDKHAGYGTKEHLEAIRKHGPCPIHRRSFGGVQEFMPG